MAFPVSLSSLRRVALAGAAILICGVLAQAQTASLSHSSLAADDSSTVSSASWSSSTDFAFTDASSAEPGTPAGASSGQYDNRKPRGGRQYTFEGGAGFNAPIGNDLPYITWGGNFTVGGGLRFAPWLSLLGEYSFIDDKLPGAFVAANNPAGGGNGSGGNTHIQSLTVEPVIDLFPKSSNGAYLIGGGGWYHKSTNFTALAGFDFYGYPVYVNAASFSSNQGGFNGGFGIYHRMGGVYGDGTAKLFAEARYLWIDTPKVGEVNGFGRTELIPVTVGVRW
jgi:hypothetical protein